METRFVDELTWDFREAYQQACAALGADQRRPKDAYCKKVHGEPYWTGDKVWLFCKHNAISKKFNFLWEGPYQVFERIFLRDIQRCERTGQRRRWQFVHFNKLKPYCVLEFQQSNTKRQAWPKTFHDASGTETEEEDVKEVAHACDDDIAGENLLEKSGFRTDSNKKKQRVREFI